MRWLGPPEGVGRLGGRGASATEVMRGDGERGHPVLEDVLTSGRWRYARVCLREESLEML